MFRASDVETNREGVMVLRSRQYRFLWEGTTGGRGGEYIDIFIHGKAEDVINTSTADPGPFGDSMRPFTVDVFLDQVNRWRFKS